jgi:hypothetical protein
MMARGRRNEDAEAAAYEHLNGEDVADGAPSPPMNSAARAEIIREAHETISEYERQVAGLKAEIKAVVETRIVAGLGMKKAHFAAARKLLELDQEERDTLQDTIRETFAALGVGMQLNWLDAVQSEPAGA